MIFLYLVKGGPFVVFTSPVTKKPFLECAVLLFPCGDYATGERDWKMITIDEFRRLELKVATIKKVAPHPNADKLLILQIDLGSEERRIVAGIKGHYTPEELVGRQIVVVANLEPAKLRGVESQGMLLAATDADGVVFITPERVVQPGARVS